MQSDIISSVFSDSDNDFLNNHVIIIIYGGAIWSFSNISYRFCDI